MFLAFLLAATWMAAPAPATDFDLQGFVDHAIETGQRQIVVPPGRYHVAPRHGAHLTLRNRADLEILADGVEMVCTQTVRAAHFEECRNVRLKGLTVDYDPLPFTEGRIMALAPDKSWLEFEILDGYPENRLEERIEIYDPATGELRRETAGWSKELQNVGPHRYRAAKGRGYRFRPTWDTEQVGDLLVTNNCSPDKAGGHAFTASRSTGLKLEDITLYASNCMGFVEDRCDGNTYLRCRIDRRGPADDPVRRAAPRMRSLNADGFHSTEAIRGPSILSCTAKFQGDDCVNIHGVYHLVTASSGATLRMAAVHRMTIEPGDPVEFLPYEGARPADAVARAVEPDGPLTEAERAFITKLHMHAPHKEALLEGHAHWFKVTLDREVNLPMGSAACSGLKVGNGFAVKDCDFGYNRSRGILIKASRGEVSGNRITRGWMAAVLVSPEFWWFEAASSSDVQVKNNTIVSCRRAAIEIVAPGGNGKPLACGAHRNISITGNTISDSPWPNIRVTSTAGLRIADNRLTPSEPQQVSPPLTVPWNWGTEQPSAVSTLNCEMAK